MPGRIYTIYTQFDQKFMPGRIRLVEFEIWPVEYGLLKAILSQWIYTIYTQFDQKFMPGRIQPVELGVNPLRLHCLLKAILSQWIYTIYTLFDQYFMPGQIWNLTSQIWPGGIEFDPPSNWVEITGMIPNSIRQAYKCNLSEFTPILTSISCLVKFDWA